MVSFYVLKKVLSEFICGWLELTILKTLVLQQIISRTGINKNKHNFTLAQIFGLPSSTGLFGCDNYKCNSFSVYYNSF